MNEQESEPMHNEIAACCDDLSAALFADYRLTLEAAQLGLTRELLARFNPRAALVLGYAIFSAQETLQDVKATDEERQIFYQAQVIRRIRDGHDSAESYAMTVLVQKQVGIPGLTFRKAARSVALGGRVSDLRRKLQGVSQNLPGRHSLPPEPYENWVADTQTALVALGRAFAGPSGTSADVQWKEVIAALLKRVEHDMNQPPDKQSGRLSWGLLDADQFLRLPRDGELIILAARPSVGKSAAAVQIARVNARKGKHIALFSLEMTAQEIALRMAAQETGLNADTLNRETEANKRLFLDALSALALLPLEVVNAAGMTVEQIAARAELVNSVKLLDGVIVDYLQIVTPSNLRAQREVQVSDISRGAKLLAMRLDRPVILLSQLNRQSEIDGRAPRLSDLRESGAIEQDGDRVVFLHRPSKNTAGDDQDVQSGNAPEVLEIHWIQAKMRNGPTTSFRSAFIGKAVRFTNLQTS